VLSVLKPELEDISALGVKTDTQLSKLDTAALERAEQNDKVMSFTAASVRNFLKWCRAQWENYGSLPSTLEEWKDRLTEESLARANIIEAKRVGEREAVPMSGRSSRYIDDDDEEHHGVSEKLTELKDRLINVKIGDYPSWNGKHDSWYNFHQEFEATA
jgi:hypothetical protein